MRCVSKSCVSIPWGIAMGGVLVLVAPLPISSGERHEDAPFYSDKTHLLYYLDKSGKQHPVRNAEDWKIRRKHILQNMQKVMGPLPTIDHSLPLDVKVLEVFDGPDFVRKLITYRSDPTDRVPAYLFIPKRRKGKSPAVLCLHPTHRPLGKKVVAGMGPKADRHYALHLVKRGYVTLAPDYVNMGGYKYDPYRHCYASATMKGIVNHIRAVDLLQSLPYVDGERIGVIGHSLGGHNAMFVAVFDQRIRCIVSNCGFCSFPRYYKGNLAGWSHNGYMPRIRTVYKLDPSKMPFDFTEVVAALAPRPFLASAPIHDHNFDVQGVKDCIEAALPVYRLLGAEEKLRANYPNCGHDFPDDARKVAYGWLDRWLKK